MKTIPQLTKVESYYDDCASLIDDDAKAMGWSSQFNQTLRFDVMNFLVDMSGCRVLDIGCGDGALFHYLNEQKIEVQYKGIDISSKMVQRAQNRYPGISVRQADFFDFDGRFDVVVCSGGLSMSSGIDPMAYLELAIDHLFSLTQEHLVFNLLSSQAPSKSPKFNRYNPQDVLALCFQKTPFVILHHGYLSHDFTVHLVSD